MFDEFDEFEYEFDELDELKYEFDRFDEFNDLKNKLD